MRGPWVLVLTAVLCATHAAQLNVQHMLVCARCKLWWMTPEWRDSTLELPPETQFLLAELKPRTDGDSVGRYALLLPLIDGDFRTTLRAGR